MSKTTTPRPQGMEWFLDSDGSGKGTSPRHGGRRSSSPDLDDGPENAQAGVRFAQPFRRSGFNPAGSKNISFSDSDEDDAASSAKKKKKLAAGKPPATLTGALESPLLPLATTRAALGSSSESSESADDDSSSVESARKSRSPEAEVPAPKDTRHLFETSQRLEYEKKRQKHERTEAKKRDHGAAGVVAHASGTTVAGKSGPGEETAAKSFTTHRKRVASLTQWLLDSDSSSGDDGRGKKKVQGRTLDNGASAPAVHAVTSSEVVGAGGRKAPRTAVDPAAASSHPSIRSDSSQASTRSSNVTHEKSIASVSVGKIDSDWLAKQTSRAKQRASLAPAATNEDAPGLKHEGQETLRSDSSDLSSSSSRSTSSDKTGSSRMRDGYVRLNPPVQPGAASLVSAAPGVGTTASQGSGAGLSSAVGRSDEAGRFTGASRKRRDTDTFDPADEGSAALPLLPSVPSGSVDGTVDEELEELEDAEEQLVPSSTTANSLLQATEPDQRPIPTQAPKPLDGFSRIPPIGTSLDDALMMKGDTFVLEEGSLPDPFGVTTSFGDQLPESLLATSPPAPLPPVQTSSVEQVVAKRKGAVGSKGDLALGSDAPSIPVSQRQGSMCPSELDSSPPHSLNTDTASPSPRGSDDSKGKVRRHPQPQSSQQVQQPASSIVQASGHSVPTAVKEVESVQKKITLKLSLPSTSILSPPKATASKRKDSAAESRRHLHFSSASGESDQSPEGGGKDDDVSGGVSENFWETPRGRSDAEGFPPIQSHPEGRRGLLTSHGTADQAAVPLTTLDGRGREAGEELLPPIKVSNPHECHNPDCTKLRDELAYVKACLVEAHQSVADLQRHWSEFRRESISHDELVRIESQYKAELAQKDRELKEQRRLVELFREAKRDNTKGSTMTAVGPQSESGARGTTAVSTQFNRSPAGGDEALPTNTLHSLAAKGSTELHEVADRVAIESAIDSSSLTDQRKVPTAAVKKEEGTHTLQHPVARRDATAETSGPDGPKKVGTVRSVQTDPVHESSTKVDRATGVGVAMRLHTDSSSQCSPSQPKNVPIVVGASTQTLELDEQMVVRPEDRPLMWDSAVDTSDLTVLAECTNSAAGRTRSGPDAEKVAVSIPSLAADESIAVADSHSGLRSTTTGAGIRTHEHLEDLVSRLEAYVLSVPELETSTTAEVQEPLTPGRGTTALTTEVSVVGTGKPVHLHSPLRTVRLPGLDSKVWAAEHRSLKEVQRMLTRAEAKAKLSGAVHWGADWRVRPRVGAGTGDHQCEVVEAAPSGDGASPAVEHHAQPTPTAAGTYSTTNQLIEKCLELLGKLESRHPPPAQSEQQPSSITNQSAALAASIRWMTTLENLIVPSSVEQWTEAALQTKQSLFDCSEVELHRQQELNAALRKQSHETAVARRLGLALADWTVETCHLAAEASLILGDEAVRNWDAVLASKEHLAASTMPPPVDPSEDQPARRKTSDMGNTELIPTAVEPHPSNSADSAAETELLLGDLGKLEAELTRYKTMWNRGQTSFKKALQRLQREASGVRGD